jgi:hypothetical protein
MSTSIFGHIKAFGAVAWLFHPHLIAKLDGRNNLKALTTAPPARLRRRLL